MNKKLWLVGAGHAHVEVVRQWGALSATRRPDIDVTLLTPDARAGYSGMMPGVIAGHYRRDEAEIDVAALCQRCGVHYVQGSLASLDVTQSALSTASTTVRYDLLSLNLGSTPAMPPIAPEALAQHWPVKPFAAFLYRLDAWLASSSVRDLRRIAVVGAGAAGIEVLLALQHRLRQLNAKPQFTLITAAPMILPGYPVALRLRVQRELAALGVTVNTHSRITHADTAGLHVEQRAPIAADAVFWATGASPVLPLEGSGLALDAAGFVQVDATLKAIEASNVFAVGDCATYSLNGVSQWPKAGVVPVRQGPHLVDNLLAALRNETPQPFANAAGALALLSLGGKRAIGTKGAWVLRGPWVWPLKDYIDRRFMAKYV